MALLDINGNPIKNDKFRVPEKYRLKGTSAPGTGNNGYFIIPMEMETKFGKRKCDICCMASDGMGWEHVSVQIMQGKQSKTPSWDIMQLVKDIFWQPDARVVQFHPPDAEYVDNHPNVLHLWRSKEYEQPFPPFEMVGLNPGRKPPSLINDIFGRLNGKKSGKTDKI